ncbi:MAG: hemolysin III family protein [archaeon]|nr:hemolysin III family protein [archaeon]
MEKDKENKRSSSIIKENDTSIKVIGTINEAPKFMIDNDYIKKGYRLNCDSLKKSIKSLFFLHNETINIWSHLLGAFFMIIVLIYTAKAIHSFDNNKIGLFYQNFKNEMNGISEKYFKSMINDIDESFKNLNTKTNLFFNDTKEKIKKNIDDYRKGFENYFEKASDNVFKNFKNDIYSRWNKFLNKIENYSIPLEDSFIKNNTKTNISLKRWPLFIMIISAILCLTFSFVYHLTNSISDKLNSFISRFDYSGISLLIAGSCFPPYYYFFYFNDICRNFYLIFISTFGIIVFFMSLREEFYKNSYRTFRGILFLTMGLSAAIPIIHLAITGFDGEGKPRILFWYIGGACYVIGTIIYIKRFPECLCPGLFDYIGASHQIFHMCVVGGVITHYIGSLDAFYYRSGNMVTTINTS